VSIWIFFPEVKGGKGRADDLFVSLNGWLVAKDAPKQPVEFMKVWLGKDVQSKQAKEGLGYGNLLRYKSCWRLAVRHAKR
jgi:hypothetical protein